ncbi:IMP dehydrogenase, partial [Escherichia sp. SS-MK2]
ITVKDFQKAERKPNACKDEQGRLRVGAAVGAGAGNEERVDALVAAGVDVLLIDSSHGHSEGVLQRIRETRAKYPDLQIIGGNVATAAGARALAEAGCSANTQTALLVFTGVRFTFRFLEVFHGD